MIADQVAAEVDSVADLVNRLGILHGDPERFHIVRDEAAKRLRRLARALREKPEPPATRVQRQAAMAEMLRSATLKRGPRK